MSKHGLLRKASDSEKYCGYVCDNCKGLVDYFCKTNDIQLYLHETIKSNCENIELKGKEKIWYV